MKKIHLICMVLSCSLFSAKAQSWGDSTNLIKPVFIAAEVNPVYPGGLKAYYQFLADNLHVPTEDISNLHRTVTIRVFINTEGNIVCASVINSVNKSYDKEALKVIKKMPAWTPAMQNGRPVSISLEIPIFFVE